MYGFPTLCTIRRVHLLCTVGWPLPNLMSMNFREELTVDNLRKLLKAELKIVAQTLNVDVTACTRKAEILDAIVTHEGLKVPRNTNLPLFALK